jgi:hypothetical protein
MPMPSPEASVSIVKESLKLDIVKLGVVVIACLRVEKAAYASSCHPKFIFFNKLVGDRAIML